MCIRDRPYPHSQEDPGDGAQHRSPGDRRHHHEQGRLPAARRFLGDGLAQSRTEGRQPGQGQSAGRADHADQGQFPAAAVEFEFVDAAVAVEEDAHGGEQRGLHARVREDVERRTARALGGHDGEPGQEQAGVRDGGEGQHPLEVALLPAHERADDGGERAEGEQHPVRVGRGDAAGAREDRPVDACRAVDAQFDHDAGQQHAHRGGGHRVGVREPEVEGDRGGLDEQAGQDEDEGGEDEEVGAVGGAAGGAVGQPGADLGEAEFAGPSVQQADAEQRRVAAEGVDDAEGEGALDGAFLLDAVAGEGVRDDAHQLEEDERVEEVAGEREAAHTRLEDQDEGGEGARLTVRRLVEVAPGVGEDGDDEQRGDGGQADAGPVADQDDADARAAVRVPAAQPCDGACARRVRGGAAQQDGEGEDGGGHGEDGARGLGGPARHPAACGHQEGGAEQRGGHDQREGGGGREGHGGGGDERAGRGHPRSSESLSGLTVPCRLPTWTTRASSSAVTVAPTTTSVRVRAWTTGSTTGRVPGRRSEKTGAVPPSR